MLHMEQEHEHEIGLDNAKGKEQPARKVNER
jgi:hypothetical protein